ncbi:MAG TPA: metalloregulator ArsR/SmtB family transcription factor [Enhygromyxa sp.]|nr:metalloregulator ArsR/SmtB family transcription factor [Enhygromyxa sp.]
MSAAERLDAAFAALADPTRRAILLRLVEGEATVNELAEPFAISQPAISRHLKVLEGAGLIVRRVDGARRPCALAPGALGELDEYLGRLRDALETNYSRLDQLLAADGRSPKKMKKGRKK